MIRQLQITVVDQLADIGPPRDHDRWLPCTQCVADTAGSIVRNHEVTIPNLLE